MKTKKRGFVRAIMLGIFVAILAILLSGCSSTKKVTSTHATSEQITTDQQNQSEREQVTAVTDTTRTETGTQQRIIIEFRDSIPRGQPHEPAPGADTNYYNYLLYLELINRIKSIEQTTNQSTTIQSGLNITDSINEQSKQSQSTTIQQSETIDNSTSEPVDITPAWVKSVRTAGIIILIIIVVYLFIKYGGIIRKIFKL